VLFLTCDFMTHVSIFLSSIKVNTLEVIIRQYIFRDFLS